MTEQKSTRPKELVAVAGTPYDRPSISWKARERMAGDIAKFLAHWPRPQTMTQIAVALSMKRSDVAEAIYHELYSSPEPRIVRVGRWVGVARNPIAYGAPGAESAKSENAAWDDKARPARPRRPKVPKPPKPPKPPSMGQLRVEQVTALLAERGPMSRRAISEATGLDRQVIDRMMAGENKWSRGRFAVLDTAPSLPQPTKLYGVAA